MSRMTRVMILASLLSAAPLWAADTRRVSLTCKPDGANVTCELVNGLAEPVLVPATPFVAEGPSGKPYLYRFIFGERYEHVFQYDLAAHGTLDKPILVDPVIHLTSEAIRDLRWLPRNGRATVRIQWKGTDGKWLMRAKMVFVRLSRLKRAMERVPSDCRTLAAGPLQRKDTLPVSPWSVHVRAASDPSYRYDRCHDVLSESFEHVASPEFRLTLKRNH